MAAEINIVIPAYNESPRIGNVLDTVCSYPQNRRIAVIDDGSIDSTRRAASEFPVTVYSHSCFSGRGAALQTAFENMPPSPYWLILSPDLIGLDHEHMDLLLEPLYCKHAPAMTVGRLADEQGRMGLKTRWANAWSGERALAGHFVEQLPSLAWAQSGVDVFLTRYAKARRWSVKYPILHGLERHSGVQKLGLAPGIRQGLQTIQDSAYSLMHWRSHQDSSFASHDHR